MNRILLIGNGFDLAHGLNTSYKHFIDNFWERKTRDVYNKYIIQGSESEFGTHNLYFDYNDDYISINNIYYNNNYGMKFSSNQLGYENSSV